MQNNIYMLFAGDDGTEIYQPVMAFNSHDEAIAYLTPILGAHVYSDLEEPLWINPSLFQIQQLLLEYRPHEAHINHFKLEEWNPGQRILTWLF